MLCLNKICNFQSGAEEEIDVKQKLVMYILSMGHLLIRTAEYNK